MVMNMKTNANYVDNDCTTTYKIRTRNNSGRLDLCSLFVVVIMVSINLMPLLLYADAVSGDSGTLDGSFSDLLVPENPSFNGTSEIIAIAEASGGCLGNTTFRLLIDGNPTNSSQLPFVQDTEKKTDSTFNILLQPGHIESTGDGEGYLNSTKISLPGGGSWDVLELKKSVTDGSMTVSICDGDSGSPISGYQNLNGSLIDISGIDGTTHTSLKLKAVFNSTEPGGAALDYWCVRWTGATGAWGDDFLKDTTVSFNWRPVKSGDINITIQLVSDDDQIHTNNNITQFVTVPTAPELGIYPNRLSVSLETGESITKTIRLKNYRGSSLTWSLATSIKSEVRVAILNDGSEPIYFESSNSNLYQHYSDALSSDSRIQGDIVTSLDSTTISGYDTIILPDNGVAISDLDDVEDWFVPGKTIICVDSAASYAGYAGFMWPDSKGSSGYNDYWAYNSQSNEQRVILEHRITQDYQLGNILNSQSGCASLYENKLEENTIVFTESNSVSTNKYAAGRNVQGGGSIFVLGPMPSGTNLVQLYPLIREACFGLEGYRTLPDWLNSSSVSGIIDPDKEIEIELTFNSTGMDPGTYEKIISFELEGGTGSVENLTVEFEVLSPLHDLGVDEIFPGGITEAGKNVTINTIITNYGRTDEQDIKVNFSVNGEFIGSNTIPFLQAATDRIESNVETTTLNGDVMPHVIIDYPIISDTFSEPTLNLTQWPGSSHSGIRTTYYNTPPSSCDLDSSEHLDSMTIDLSGYTSAQVNFFYRRSGIDNGEYLRLYYYSDSSQWVDIWNVNGGSSDSSFIPVSVDLPAGAFHENFRFKLQISPGGSSSDDIYVDDVELKISNNPVESYLISESISLPHEASWRSLDISKTEMDGGWVHVSLLYENGTPIPGFQGLSSTIIDLSALQNESAIKLRADFSVDAQHTSILHEWTVFWVSAYDNGSWIDSFSNSGELSFNWTPPIAGDYLVEVSSVPVPGEDLISTNVLNATITITAEPDIRVDPSGFDITIDQGEVSDMNLTIGNEGLANLDYEIFDETAPSYAINFQGDDDYIRSTTLGNFGTHMDKGFSLELWLNTSTVETERFFMGSFNDEDNTGIQFGVNYPTSADLYMYLRDENGVRLSGYVNNANIFDDEWHHIVYVVSDPAANDLKIFIDGENQPITYRQNEGPSDFQNLNYDMILGARNNRGVIDTNFDGHIDEVRLLGRALTQEEISEDYLTGGHYVYREGSVGWWHFDENSGDIAYDFSGNKNDGMISDALWMEGYGTMTLANWVSATPNSGTINPRENTTVSLETNASRLDPGFYQIDLPIGSNDPDEGIITIPVNLTVNPVDHEIKVTNIRAPVTGEAEENITVNATILNQGLSNETNIIIRLMVNGEEIDNLTLVTLNSGNSTAVSFNWTPAIAGEYLVEIWAVPVSGENITFNNVHGTTVTITADPNIWIDPTDFNMTIHTGETTDVNLTIGNNGLGFLNWEITNTGKPLFIDTFEDGDYNGWMDAGGSYTREVTDQTAADGSRYSLSLTGGSTTHNNGLKYTLPNIQPTYLEFHVRFGSTSIADGYFILSDANGRNLLLFYGGNTGNLYANEYLSFPYSSNTWYHIELKDINWTLKTYDLFIDSHLIQENHAFGNSAVADLTTINLYNYQNSQAWWDEIVMRTSVGENEDWVDFSPAEGIVDPLSNITVTLTVNTTGRDPGHYRTNLTITSNDQSEDRMVIPINLTVEKQDHDIEIIDMESPWYATCRDGAEIEATLRNNGKNDETNVQVNLSVDGKTDMTMTVPYIQSEENRIDSFWNATTYKGSAGLFRGEGGVLFEDSFPISTLNTGKWPGSLYSGMTSSYYYSSPYSCILDSSEHIDSTIIDLSGYSSGYVSFRYRRAGIDNGEYLRLYYYSRSSTWIDIWNVNGGSYDDSFIFVNVSLPEEALHEGFRFKLQINPGGSSSDDVYIDDVEMGAMTGPGIINNKKAVFEDSFSSSLLDTLKWPGSTYTGMTTSAYASPPYSCNLDSAEHIDSMSIDLSGDTSAHIAFCYERAGIDNGEYLRLYYYTSSSQWFEIWSINGGSVDNSFVPVLVDLPAGAFHENFKFRLQISPGGTTNDDVLIDDVELIVVEPMLDGFIVSESIHLPDGFIWESLNLTKEEGNESQVFVSVLYENGTGIPGLENLTGTDIDLSVAAGLDGETIIRLKAYFSTTGNDSYLENWNIVYVNSSDAADTGFWQDTFSNEVTVSLNWRPEDGGWKDVAVVTTPVPGETLLTNNRGNETIWCFRSRGNVLVDYGHGSYASMDSPGNYDDFQYELFMAGFEVATTTEEITGELLGQYDVFLSMGTSLNYLNGERTAIQEFVAAGGGFMVLGGRNSYNNYNLLTNYANITWQSPGGSSGETDQIEEHTITEGISSLYCQEAIDSMVVSDQAVACVFERNGDYIQVAASEYGNGKIVALLDEYWFSNARLYQVDNLQLGLNILKWFTYRNVITVNGTRDYSRLVGAGDSLDLEIHLTNNYVWNDTFNLNITSELPAGWNATLETSSVYLPSGETVVIILTVLVPSERSYPDNATIVIEASLENNSRYDDARIDLVIPPVIGTVPNSISVEVPMDELMNFTTDITIANTGDGDLGWEISYDLSVQSEAGQDPIRILAWTAFANLDIDYPNTLGAIDRYFTNYIISETMTSQSDALRSALEGQDVFLLPEQQYADHMEMVGDKFSDVLRDFVEGGGTLVSCGAQYDNRNIGFLDATGLVELQYEEYTTRGCHGGSDGSPCHTGSRRRHGNSVHAVLLRENNRHGGSGED